MGPIGLRREMFRVAAGHSLFNPGGQCGPCGLRHASRADKLAVLGVGVPGWHAILLNDFQHHFAPADDFVVVGQRKRSDFAGAMTLDAMLIQNRPRHPA